MKYIHIPNEVAFNKKLPYGSKILYGLIYSIYTLKKEPVRASNDWLAEKMNLHKRQLQRYLSALYNLKLIKIVTIRDGQGKVKERNIIPHVRYDI